MKYQEHPPSEPLRGLVKAFWKLDAEGVAGTWARHQATPDGCIELILRQVGQSRWRGDQPDRFAVGQCESADSFEISGDARFIAIRLWPWAWHAIRGSHPKLEHGNWQPAQGETLDQLYATIEQPVAAEAVLLAIIGERHTSLQTIGLGILQSRSVSEMSLRTGMHPRRLQRWFHDNVGLAPRHYLRLIRFQKAFEELANANLLADHAAKHGFADQAHMAREFRQLAGNTAKHSRNRTQGPFLG